MAKLLTTQDMVDGRLDIKALGEAANGDENTQVVTRTGETYPSARKAINMMFQNGGLPAKPFATKTEMTTEAATLTEGAYALVTNDIVSNNGLYKKISGVLTKQSYNDITSLDALTINMGKNYPFTPRAKNGVTSSADTSALNFFLDVKILNARADSYYSIDWYQNGYSTTSFPNKHSWVIRRYLKNGYETGYAGGDVSDPQDGDTEISGTSLPQTNRLYKDTGIQSVTVDLYAGYTEEITITVNTAALPEYGQRMRWSGDTDGTRTWTVAETCCDTSTVTSKTVERIRPLLETSSSISEKLVSVGESLQHTKTQGFYLRTDGSVSETELKPFLYISEFLRIDRSAPTISFNAHGLNFIAAYQLFDAHFNFILGSNGSNSADQLVTLATSDLPTNAAYIRYTGNININSSEPVGVVNKSLGSFVKDLITANMPEYGSSITDIAPNINGIFITGASFTHSGNAWFGIATDKLSAIPINKARSGYGQPRNDAWDIWKNNFITDAEFEDIDLFCFMYSSVPELDVTEGLLDDLTHPDEYTIGFDPNSDTNPFLALSHAQAMDYVLKKLRIRCYDKKDDPESKWFNNLHGKPFQVMLCTSWHDSRDYNSEPVRALAARWGFALCPFDEKIGFSKTTPLFNGVQVSRLYSMDTQTIDGVVYGWHPRRTGNSDYIQNRIASIFTQSVVEWFGY